MQERFREETAGLIRSWMRHDRAVLRDYLVQDVEDPRINIQSILTRHFLITRLFGERFSALMQEELRFGLVINWLLKLVRASVQSWQLHAVLDALLQDQSRAEGLRIPRFVSETFARLALPNYICDLFAWAPVETTDVPIPEHLMNTFQGIWREVLHCQQPGRISVLEPACGSANDYRFFDAFGIARLLDYIGFDLCEKNVANAKGMFPGVGFRAGNVLDIDAVDEAFDYCFVHDLFEHLSIEAMEVAISELCRITRQDICVGFFNMHKGDRHIVRPVRHYHWNTLSMVKTKAIFERHAGTVQVIHIDTFLTSQFGYDGTHNKAAYTFIIRK